jgi:uncharacterized membrane protein
MRPSDVDADLAAVVAITEVAEFCVLLRGIESTAGRGLLAAPVLLFAPGYAVVSALFPRDKPIFEFVGGATPAWMGLAGEDGEDSYRGIERPVLSVVASVLIVALLALAYARLTGRFDGAVVFGLASLVAVAGAVVAAIRRRPLPRGQRVGASVKGTLARIRGAFSTDRPAVLAVNLLLVASVLVGASSVAFALSEAESGEAYTEFYLLSENESGQLSASDYPTNITAGNPTSLVVGVDNQEDSRTEYTVVVEVQRVTEPGDAEDPTVLEERELTRRQRTVDVGGTWRWRHVYTPQVTGENLRLRYYLYRGDAPADASERTAYRDLALWISVSNG